MWDTLGMSVSHNTLTRRDGLELLAAWRRRADYYDRQAELLRLDGDTVGAEELEQVSTDYLLACDRLDLDTLPATLPVVA